jgi:general secretion pathway protein K
MMRRARIPRQRGVALVAVLWIVSALTILTAGVVGAVRQEIRSADTGRSMLEATAIGRGAIQQVLQSVAGAGAQRPDRLHRRTVQFDGAALEVEVQPMTGLIDLNVAPEPLLAELLAQVAGMPGNLAAQAAARIASRRTSRPFDAPEDVAEVQGLDYDVYAQIRNYVATGTRGAGRVHPLAASPEVLLVLARGNAAVAARIAQDRDAGAQQVDTSRLEALYADPGAGGASRYRFTARVPAPDGRIFAVALDADLSASAALPWQVMRTQTQLAAER